MNIALNTPQSFVDQFDAVRGRLLGSKLPWLEALREAGIEKFAAIGVPNIKMESWKYTRLPNVNSSDFRSANWEDGQVSVKMSDGLLSTIGEAIRLVYVNGVIRPELSNLDKLPDGVTLEPLAQALENDPDFVKSQLSLNELESDQGFLALNAAMMESGTVFKVAKGVQVQLLRDPNQLRELHFRVLGGHQYHGAVDGSGAL